MLLDIRYDTRDDFPDDGDITRVVIRETTKPVEKEENREEIVIDLADET